MTETESPVTSSNGYLSEPCIDDLAAKIAQATDRYAERTEIIDDTRSVNYQELGHMIRCCVSSLQSNGVDNGHVVPILINRSIDSIVAILAIHRLGASYVPFDARWPEERHRQILNTLNANVYIADSEFKAEGLANSQIIKPENWKNVEPSDTVRENNPSDLAYILFTSGTSGTPKGVCISHRAASAFVNWTIDEFDLSAQDRVVGVSSFTFDLSIFDVFSTLSVGATLFLFNLQKLPQVRSFARYIDDNSISVIYTVPTTLMLMVSRGKLSAPALPSLRLVLFAGEQYPISAFNLLQSLLHSSVEYANLYGPTETNVCTYHRVTGLEMENEGIPIGKPLPWAHASIDKECSDDEHGELIIAGAGIMDGYWGEKLQKNSSQYTATDKRGCAIGYKTGDLVKQDRFDNYILLGRKDGMLKVNGFRVEASEVESLLLRVKGVSLAAVAVPDITDSNAMAVSRFYAFLVISDGYDEKGIISDAKALCSEWLPAYSRPNVYKITDSIPTTVSGKIDRRKLASSHPNTI